jgi:segregation and condensation protein B
MHTSARIEAILFYKAGPVSIEELARMLQVSNDEIATGLDELEQVLASRGIRLLHKGDEVVLGTAPETSSEIEALVKDELAKDLGKAGLETLAIVLYRGPISRADIDYIRGVNSTFILRNLLVRGLVERIPHDRDQRSFLYRPTFELLGYLGVTRVEDLPDYALVTSEINALYERRTQEEKIASEEAITQDDAPPEEEPAIT